MTITETALSTRQTRLLELLACPQCRSPLDLDQAVVRHDGVAAGDLLCATHGRVGVIDRHRPSFVDRELENFAPGTAATRLTEVSAGSDMVKTVGRWWSIPEGWAAAAEPGVAMVVEGAFRTAMFDVQRDEWSPVVELLVDGEVRGVYDLASREGGNVINCVFETSDERSIVLRVASSVPAGRLVVRDTRIDVDASSLPATRFDRIDQGNRFPATFLRLLRKASPESIALDCGGGDRRLGDPRVFNLDRLWCEAADLCADGSSLPFADASFDLMLSQSVLEHVPDPMRAVAEMHRVIRPGGTICCEVGFDRPQTIEKPQYFKITPQGAEHLFQEWDINSIDCIGGVSEMVEQWDQVLDLRTRMDTERLGDMRSLLSEVDDLMTSEQREQVAAGLLIVATRRS